MTKCTGVGYKTRRCRWRATVKAADLLCSCVLPVCQRRPVLCALCIPTQTIPRCCPQNELVSHNIIWPKRQILSTTIKDRLLSISNNLLRYRVAPPLTTPVNDKCVEIDKWNLCRQQLKATRGKWLTTVSPYILYVSMKYQYTSVLYISG